MTKHGQIKLNPLKTNTDLKKDFTISGAGRVKIVQEDGKPAIKFEVKKSDRSPSDRKRDELRIKGRFFEGELYVFRASIKHPNGMSKDPNGEIIFQVHATTGGNGGPLFLLRIRDDRWNIQQRFYDTGRSSDKTLKQKPKKGQWQTIEFRQYSSRKGDGWTILLIDGEEVHTWNGANVPSPKYTDGVYAKFGLYKSPWSKSQSVLNRSPDPNRIVYYRNIQDYIGDAARAYLKNPDLPDPGNGGGDSGDEGPGEDTIPFKVLDSGQLKELAIATKSSGAAVKVQLPKGFREAKALVWKYGADPFDKTQTWVKDPKGKREEIFFSPDVKRGVSTYQFEELEPNTFYGVVFFLSDGETESYFPENHIFYVGDFDLQFRKQATGDNWVTHNFFKPRQLEKAKFASMRLVSKAGCEGKPIQLA